MKTNASPNAARRESGTLSEIVLADLRARLAESPAITSPECLKRSIMRSRYVSHFADKVAEAYPHYTRDTCEFFAGAAFDNAVDVIYDKAPARIVTTGEAS